MRLGEYFKNQDAMINHLKDENRKMRLLILQTAKDTMKFDGFCPFCGGVNIHCDDCPAKNLEAVQ